MTAVGTNLMI